MPRGLKGEKRLADVIGNKTINIVSDAQPEIRNGSRLSVTAFAAKQVAESRQSLHSANAE
jgi:hypothetical protein